MNRYTARTYFYHYFSFYSVKKKQHKILVAKFEIARYLHIHFVELLSTVNADGQDDVKKKWHTYNIYYIVMIV